ncbi:MAG: hypothetical protein ABUT39_29435 [Acidobacteriota bacterium]
MKERLIAPPRSAVPVPGAGSVFGRGFFRNLRAAGGGGCFLLFFMSIGAGLFLFGLAGTFGPYKEGLRENGDPRFFLAAMAVGSVFFLVGLRMLQLALTGAQNERRVRGDAKEPWTWDHPWSTQWMKPDYSGTGAGTFLGRVAFLALLAVFNVAWTSGIVLFKIIVGIFDLIGLLVLYDSLQKVLTWIRVRQPVVIWSRVPAFLGERLEGRIAFARRVSARGPAKLTLRRVEDEWVENRSSNGGSTRALEPFTVYQQEQEAALSGQSDVLDFAFDLPNGQKGTDLAKEEAVYWQLLVVVPVLGPDIEAVFLAPVYRGR